MKTISIVILAGILLVSCGKKEDPKNTTTEKKDTVTQKTKQPDEKTTPPASDTGKTKTSGFTWEFKKLGEGSYGAPLTQVNLLISGSTIEVEKTEFGFFEMKKSEYADYHIPAGAITACRGWWAGAGIDYWVIKTSAGYDIFSREVGESNDENGEPSDYMGKPKKIKTINTP